jgi:hypothetical protein
MKNFDKNRKARSTKTPKKVDVIQDKISPASIENKQPRAGKK